MIRRRDLIQVGKHAVDLVLLTGSFWLAYLLRDEGALPANDARTFLCCLPFVLLLQHFCLAVLGLSRCPWRYFCYLEGQRVLLALLAANGLLSLWRVIAGAFS